MALGSNRKSGAFSEDSGGMEEEIMADINMTPLIDIMLVLLIIFMVTSTVALESGLDIDLPESSSTKASVQDNGKAVIVSLDEAGKLFVQGNPVDVTDLTESIRDALIQEKTQLVIFEGDTQSTLGKTISVMDQAKEAGASRFAIASE